MSKSSERPPATGSPKRTLGRWVRQIHFFASLGAAGLILFFAVTGFVAARSDLFDTDDRPVETSGGMLPPTVALEARGVADWLAAELPGRLCENSVEEEDQKIRFEMESVWSWHAISVDLETRRYVAETTPASWAGVAIGLHRGKWAGTAQRLLLDAASLALALTVLTGIYMAATHPSRLRRWLAIGLVTASMVLVIMFCLGR